MTGRRKPLSARIRRFLGDLARNLTRRGVTKWREDCMTLFSAAIPAVVDANAAGVSVVPDMKGSALYALDWPLVPSALPNMAFSRDTSRRYDYCFIWGMGRKEEQCAVLANARSSSSTSPTATRR